MKISKTGWIAIAIAMLIFLLAILFFLMNKQVQVPESDNTPPNVKMVIQGIGAELIQVTETSGGNTEYIVPSSDKVTITAVGWDDQGVKDIKLVWHYTSTDGIDAEESVNNTDDAEIGNWANVRRSVNKEYDKEFETMMFCAKTLPCQIDYTVKAYAYNFHGGEAVTQEYHFRFIKD